MLFSYVVLAILGSAAVSECGSIDHLRLHQATVNRRTGSRVIRRQANPTCLAPGVLATGSALTGQENGTAGIKPGQAPSATDPANFINFCVGKNITDGFQTVTGSCNPVPMGNIPAKTNMVSTIITNPEPGQLLSAFVTFNVTIQVAHLQAGKFTNPTTTYYSAPQDLNAAGDIIGHAHITIQDLGGSFSPKKPLDATVFAFFKGIDDAGDGNGGLQATVTGGLPAGFYRICTMNSAANHQPVNMPVAQRGAQDDCTKVRVINDGKGTPPPASTATVAATSVKEQATATSSAKATAAAGKGGKGSGKGGKGSSGSGSSSSGSSGSGSSSSHSSGSHSSGSGSSGSGSSGSGSSGSGSSGSGSSGSSSSGSGSSGSGSTGSSSSGSGGSSTTNPGSDNGSSGGSGGNALTSAIGTAPASTATGSASATSLPGPPVKPVTSSTNPSRPFQCNGVTFKSKVEAKAKACLTQFETCVKGIKGGMLRGSEMGCEKQRKICDSA